MQIIEESAQQTNDKKKNQSHQSKFLKQVKKATIREAGILRMKNRAPHESEANVSHKPVTPKKQNCRKSFCLEMGTVAAVDLSCRTSHPPT